jgi:hypothetical protein
MSETKIKSRNKKAQLLEVLMKAVRLSMLTKDDRDGFLYGAAICWDLTVLLDEEEADELGRGKTTGRHRA